MLSLEQVRGFIAVAELLHFGRAAESLNMTQPPLSRQIQNLEQAIGAQLFERTNRRVELTTAGQAFLVDAHQLIAIADRAPHIARRAAEGASGIVRIGFTAAAAYSILGPMLSALSAALPDIDIELQEMVTAEILKTLGSGEIDVGLARPPFDASLFASNVVVRERLVVAFPSAHRFSGWGRPIAAEDLQDIDLIMHSPTQARYFYDATVRVVTSSAVSIHIVREILTMVLLVSAGRGVALVPESAMRLRVDGVQYAELEGFSDHLIELHAVRRLPSMKPAVRRVMAVIEEFSRA